MIYSNHISARHNFLFSQNLTGWPILQTDHAARPAPTVLGIEVSSAGVGFEIWLGAACLSSHMRGICTPKLHCTCYWPKTVLKGISLISLSLLRAAPDQIYGHIWCLAPCQAILATDSLYFFQLWVPNHHMERKRILYLGRSEVTSNSGPNAYAEVSTISLPHCQIHPQNHSSENSSSANMYWARTPNNTLCGWM